MLRVNHQTANRLLSHYKPLNNFCWGFNNNCMEYRYANDFLAVSLVMWWISQRTKSVIPNSDKQDWFRLSVQLPQGPKAVANGELCSSRLTFYGVDFPLYLCLVLFLFFPIHLANAFFSNRFWVTFEKITSGALRHFFWHKLSAGPTKFNHQAKKNRSCNKFNSRYICFRCYAIVLLHKQMYPT